MSEITTVAREAFTPVSQHVERLVGEKVALEARIKQIEYELEVAERIRAVIFDGPVEPVVSTNGADAAEYVDAGQPFKEPKPKRTPRQQVSDGLVNRVHGVLLHHGGELTIKQVASRVKVSTSAAKLALDVLLEQRRVRKVGSTGGPSPSMLWTAVDAG